MVVEEVPFSKLLSTIVDNRGKTCPTADEGIPLIATNCIRNDLLYPTYEKARFVSQETYDSWFRGHPKPGDILFVNKATPGRVCLVPDPIDFCIAQDMVAVRADPSAIYPRYLFAVLRSPIVQERIAQMHVGSLIPHFKKGDFDKLLLPVPHKTAQEFIGDTYFNLSAKIELNRRRNQTLEAMARALFKDWFVDFGPVRAKMEGREPYLPADIWKLFPDRLDEGGKPEGWSIQPLGNFVEILDSRRVPLSGKQRAERPGPYPYHGAAGVMDSIDDYLFEGVHILLGEDGSVVKPSGRPYTQYAWGKFWVNNHAHVLRGKGISNETLLTFLDQCDIAPFVTGAVQLKLSQGNLKAVPFIDAGKSILEKFGDTVTPLYDQLRTTSDESATLAQLRDTLLPKLVSGELRLSDADKLIKRAGQ